MEISLSNEEPVITENNINFIPCSINFNGKAKVSSYFKEKSEENGVKYSSFRGRPLLGCEMKIPDGYSGYVLKKQPKSMKTKITLLNVEQSFENVTYWNLDKIPSHNDAFASATDWFDISAALHSKEELPMKNSNGTESS